MAAYTESGVPGGNGNSVVKGGTRGHESGRGKDTCLMKFENGAVDA
jgi:hypothetical protein